MYTITKEINFLTIYWQLSHDSPFAMAARLQAEGSSVEESSFVDFSTLLAALFLR
jgi:hypothetical protein